MYNIAEKLKNYFYNGSEKFLLCVAYNHHWDKRKRPPKGLIKIIIGYCVSIIIRVYIWNEAIAIYIPYMLTWHTLYIIYIT